MYFLLNAVHTWTTTLSCNHIPHYAPSELSSLESGTWNASIIGNIRNHNTVLSLEGDRELLCVTGLKA